MKHAIGFGGLGSTDSYSSTGTQWFRRHVVSPSCNETGPPFPIDNAERNANQYRVPLLTVLSHDMNGIRSAPAVHRKTRHALYGFCEIERTGTLPDRTH